MTYRVAVEDIEPGHYVAWVLDLPGCFAKAPSLQEAVSRTAESITHYVGWVRQRDPTLPAVDPPFSVTVVETFEATVGEHDPDYLVNAFFEDDRRPLSYWDVALALNLLQWTREDLLQIVETLSPDKLRRPLPGEGWRSMTAIIEHVANAENWYLGHLGHGLPTSTLPEEPLERLRVVRQQMRDALPALIGDVRLTEESGETWSPRKMVRRALWHERDHTGHVARLAARAL